MAVISTTLSIVSSSECNVIVAEGQSIILKLLHLSMLISMWYYILLLVIINFYKLGNSSGLENVTFPLILITYTLGSKHLSKSMYNSFLIDIRFNSGKTWFNISTPSCDLWPSNENDTNFGQQPSNILSYFAYYNYNFSKFDRYNGLLNFAIISSPILIDYTFYNLQLSRLKLTVT